MCGQESLEPARQRRGECVDRVGVEVKKSGVPKHQSDVFDALLDRPATAKKGNQREATATTAATAATATVRMELKMYYYIVAQGIT